MKRLFTSLVFIALTINFFAQSPQKMSYQCVVRNASGALVINQGVGMRVSILQGSATGTVLYQEIFNPYPKTSANGLVTVEIGGGVPITGLFSTINWASGTYFLKIETDPTGGTNYTITGTSQLLSVPYAIHAKTAENGFSGNYNDLSDKPILFDGSWTNVTGKPTTVSGYGIIDAVTTSGDQTISGKKTFSGTTSVTTPVNSNDAVNKAYIDAILQDAKLEIYAEMGISDIDGNNYKSVKIDTHIWMAENLKVTHYSDGTPIPNLIDNTAWINDTLGAYCWNNNNIENKNVYGALYNWYAVDAGSNGGKNICPVGWHVPSLYEFNMLTGYLGGLTVAGGKLKEAGTIHWLSPNEGATNEYGFTALPSGGRFGGLGGSGWWWCTDVQWLSPGYPIMWAWALSVQSDRNEADMTPIPPEGGSSVRCLKDNSLPSVSTTDIYNISFTTATSGGSIDGPFSHTVIDRGVCWSKNPNPTILDSKTSDGPGTYNFTSNLINLQPNTTYYVRAYATNNQGTAYGLQVSFKTMSPIIFNPDLTYGTVSDIDGNTYKTIQIGTQTWMAENLKTIKYKDGTAIPNVTSQHEWDALTSPAYCWYNNDIGYKDVYGALYNWYTVNTGKLCPSGWYVPTNAEWTILTTYLGGESVAGCKLKEIGITHWETPNIGATNESGFTALPGSKRSIAGTMFEDIDYAGFWWSATVSNFPRQWFIFPNDCIVHTGTSPNLHGMAIRCLKY